MLLGRVISSESCICFQSENSSLAFVVLQRPWHAFPWIHPKTCEKIGNMKVAR